MVRSIRHLHHQRRLSRVMRGKPKNRLALSRRCCAALADPSRSALSSVSGSSPRSLRQAPRLWARAIRHEPRDPGLPFRLAPGCSNEPCFGQQKPSGASGSGGFAATGLVSVRLCEIAPMSRACAIDWREAIREPDELFVPVVHERTRVVSRPTCSRGRGTYARNLLLSRRCVCENCDSWRDLSKTAYGCVVELGFL